MEVINYRQQINGGTCYDLAGNTYSNCIGTEDGGAFYVAGGTLTGSALFTGNTVAAYGGAVNNGEAGIFTGSSISFAGNTASYNGNYYGGHGGAVYNSGTMTISDSDFSNNSADNYGGAVYNTGGTFTGSGLSFIGNSAVVHGGAVYNYGSMDLTDCFFSSNIAKGNGGAVVNVSTASISGCTFTGNTAFQGGAFNANNNTAIITDSLFTDNVADMGGAVLSSSETTISGCTFAGNTASRGGAIYASGQLTLSGVTFSGNTATNGGAIYNKGGVYLAGEVVLATASDTFVNEVALIWDLTGDTCGTLSGYQYLNNSGNLRLLIDGEVESGDSFTIASGVFDDITGKDTFTITRGADEYDGEEITIGGSVNYAGLSWKLGLTGTAADGQLVLTAGPGREPAIRADFNATGVSDVVIVDGKKLSVLYDSGSKFVQSGTLSNLHNWTVVVPEGDYNGDTRADVLITSKTNGIRTLAGLFNIGAGSQIKFKGRNIFRYKTAEWSYRAKGDVNGDGTTDIVIVLKGEKAVEMGLKGRVVQVKALGKDGKVNETVTMGMLRSGECVLGTADVKGNGTDNILVWNTKNDLICYWKSAGAGLTAIDLASGLDFVASGDFNGDGADELLWQKEDGSYASWQDLAGDAVTKTDLGFAQSGWSFRQVGDYNGDGSEELLWAADDGSLAYSSTGDIKKLTVISAK